MHPCQSEFELTLVPGNKGESFLYPRSSAAAQSWVWDGSPNLGPCLRYNMVLSSPAMLESCRLPSISRIVVAASVYVERRDVTSDRN